MSATDRRTIRPKSTATSEIFVITVFFDVRRIAPSGTCVAQLARVIRTRPAKPVQRSKQMNSLINILTRLGLLKDDLDYHLIRASMVIIFLFFGYQKWFDYEAQTLIPCTATDH
jgi:Protein of unknown function, DUF417